MDNGSAKIKMRKIDKKIENAIRGVLNEVCDIALDRYKGFRWLTHFVNYQNFPASMSIVCVFDRNEQLSKKSKEELNGLIMDKLASIDITFNDIRQHVSFDSEESCEIEHGGKWHERFK